MTATPIATQRALCGYARIQAVTADELTGDRVGALEGDETGWIGYCKCGWGSPVRYSPISAQSAVCAHVFRAAP